MMVLAVTNPILESTRSCRMERNRAQDRPRQGPQEIYLSLKCMLSCRKLKIYAPRFSLHEVVIIIIDHGPHDCQLRHLGVPKTSSKKIFCVIIQTIQAERWTCR